MQLRGPHLLAHLDEVKAVAREGEIEHLHFHWLSLVYGTLQSHILGGP